MESCSRQRSVLQVCQESFWCPVKNGNVLLRGIFGMFELSLRISSNAVREPGQLLNA